MKNIFFLSALPRAGNTLLGSIINQNKNIQVTANSIVTDLLWETHKIKDFENYRNFPDENSFNSVFNNVINNYYSKWKANFIIDRGPWGTPANLFLLKQIIKNPKFVLLKRPVLECLASYIKLEKPVDIENRCFELMSNTGMIGKNMWSVKNIIEQKENYILIDYVDLVKDPKKEIKKIFKFLNIKDFKISLNNLKQFSANNISYDDSILNLDYHTIRTDKIELDKYKITDILSKKIIKQYSNLDIN
jgi:hypothetical protein